MASAGSGAMTRDLERSIQPLADGAVSRTPRRGAPREGACK